MHPGHRLRAGTGCGCAFIKHCPAARAVPHTTHCSGGQTEAERGRRPPARGPHWHPALQGQLAYSVLWTKFRTTEAGPRPPPHLPPEPGTAAANCVAGAGTVSQSRATASGPEGSRLLAGFLPGAQLGGSPGPTARQVRAGSRGPEPRAGWMPSRQPLSVSPQSPWGHQQEARPPRSRGTRGLKAAQIKPTPGSAPGLRSLPRSPGPAGAAGQMQLGWGLLAGPVGLLLGLGRRPHSAQRAPPAAPCPQQGRAVLGCRSREQPAAVLGRPGCRGREGGVWPRWRPAPPSEAD